MASNALVTTRINENIKHEATEVLATMGLTVSDAVRLLLTKVAMEEDLSKAKSFTSVKDLMADLNADD